MDSEQPKRTGRPSTYSEETAAAICELIADGQSLVEICKRDDMPVRSTVFKWLAQNQLFADMYAQARIAQADHMFDEIIAIADDGSNDFMEKKFGEETKWVENGEAIRRSALRVDARKWAAAKLAPRKYGEKITQEVTGADGTPLIPEAPMTPVEISRWLMVGLKIGSPAIAPPVASVTRDD